MEVVTFTKFTYAGEGYAAGKYYAVDGSGKLVKAVWGARDHYIATRIAMEGLEGVACLIRQGEATSYLTTGVSVHGAALCLSKQSFEKGGHKHHLPIIQMGDSSTRHIAAPSLMLIDTDDIEAGEAGVIDQLAAVIPTIGHYQRIETSSSSANIYHEGRCLKGESGQHTFFAVADGTDIPRALTMLHKRLWAAGYGKGRVSSAGSFLERSVVDRQLTVPSQPIFLRPHLGEGLTQEKWVRFFDGIPLLDTKVLIPNLNYEEYVLYDEAVRDTHYSMIDELVATKEKHFNERVDRAYNADPSMPREVHLQRLAETLRTRELAPNDVIELSNGATVTVAQILARPEYFHEQTCRDPLEHDYGSPTVAKIYSDQAVPVIKSFAHCLPGDQRIFRMRGAD